MIFLFSFLIPLYGNPGTKLRGKKKFKKKYVLKLTKISLWIYGLKDFPHV